MKILESINLKFFITEIILLTHLKNNFCHIWTGWGFWINSMICFPISEIQEGMLLDSGLLSSNNFSVNFRHFKQAFMDKMFSQLMDGSNFYLVMRKRSISNLWKNTEGDFNPYINNSNNGFLLLVKINNYQEL